MAYIICKSFCAAAICFLVGSGTEPKGCPRVHVHPMNFFDIVLIFEKLIDFS
jgi:hypothetical protein